MFPANSRELTIYAFVNKDQTIGTPKAPPNHSKLGGKDIWNGFVAQHLSNKDTVRFMVEITRLSLSQHLHKLDNPLHLVHVDSYLGSLPIQSDNCIMKTQPKGTVIEKLSTLGYKL